MFADGVKRNAAPCPQPREETGETPQLFSSQSTTGSVGTKPGCCAPPLLGGSPAQMSASQGPRAGGVLPQFRPMRHFPLLVRFVSLMSLEFFFSFLLHLLLKEIWLHLLSILRSEAVKRLCVLVFQNDRKSINRVF